MGTVSGSNVENRSGSGSIDVTWDGTNPLPDTTMSVSELDSISYEADVEDEATEASFVFFQLGTLTFKVFDKLGNGDSFFEELDQIDANESIDVSFSFTFDESGRSFTENYQFQTKDVEYDYERREITIEAQPSKPTEEITDIFTNNPSDIYDFDTGSQVVDCIPMSRYIDITLGLLNSGNTNKNESLHHTDIGQTSGTRSYVSVRLDTGGRNCLLPVFEAAAIEGAFVGSFMGYSFFVNRLKSDNFVEISTSDCEVLNIGLGLNSYRSIRSFWKSGDHTGGGFNRTGDADGLNSDADKRLDIYWHTPNRIAAGIWDGVDTYDVSTASIYSGSSVFCPFGAKEGAININLDDGSGGNAPLNISDGDLIFFVDPNGEIVPTPLYVADGANTASQLTLRDPLIKDVGSGWEVYIVTSGTAEEPIIEDGVDAYSAAYSADGSTFAEITIFGIDTLKPYESLKFGTDFPAPLAGKIYRPSSLEYQFEGDRIQAELYRIST